MTKIFHIQTAIAMLLLVSCSGETKESTETNEIQNFREQNKIVIDYFNKEINDEDAQTLTDSVTDADIEAFIDKFGEGLLHYDTIECTSEITIENPTVYVPSKEIRKCFMSSHYNFVPDTISDMIIECCDITVLEGIVPKYYETVEMYKQLLTIKKEDNLGYVVELMRMMFVCQWLNDNSSFEAICKCALYACRGDVVVLNPVTLYNVIKSRKLLDIQISEEACLRWYSEQIIERYYNFIFFEENSEIIKTDEEAYNYVHQAYKEICEETEANNYY